MRRTLLLGTLSVSTALLGWGGAPAPANASDLDLYADNHFTATRGPGGTSKIGFFCFAIVHENHTNIPGTTEHADPGANIVIDDCSLRIDPAVVWKSSAPIASGPAAATEYVVVDNPTVPVMACVSAHATLSSNETRTFSRCEWKNN